MTRLLSVHLMAASEGSADHLPVVTDRPDLAWKIQCNAALSKSDIRRVSAGPGAVSAASNGHAAREPRGASEIAGWKGV
jgi:hypothetical protein